MKLSKTAKYTFIAIGAAAVLAAAAAVLMLTEPKEEASSDAASGKNYVQILKKSAEKILRADISNENGVFSFKRKNSGNDIFWECDELKNVNADVYKISSMMTEVSSFAAQLVEEAPDDIEKYSLDKPKSRAVLEFEDGEKAELVFGIDCPTDAEKVYMLWNGDVYLAQKAAFKAFFEDVRYFADVVMTEKMSDENRLKVLKISRKDLEEPVEAQYMFDLLDTQGDFVAATANTHRFTAPFVAEIDQITGRSIYENLYGLTMERCVFLEKNEENLEKCGLSEPFCEVYFEIGDESFTLLIGGEVSDSPSSGYYAAMIGAEGIFEISRSTAVWRGLVPENYVSRRPIAPYIYYVEKIEVTVPKGRYVFEINSEEKTFSCGGKQLSSGSFRAFYTQLIGSYGEDLYSGEINGECAASIRFIYNEKYSEKYGVSENLAEFYDTGERKLIAALDKKALFRTSKAYVQRLYSNIDALLSGGEVVAEW